MAGAVTVAVAVAVASVSGWVKEGRRKGGRKKVVFSPSRLFFFFQLSDSPTEPVKKRRKYENALRIRGNYSGDGGGRKCKMYARYAIDV